MGFLPLPVTSVNASVITIIMTLCICITPFILLRGSKSFTNIITLNPLNLHVRQVMTRAIIPIIPRYKVPLGGAGM